MPGTQVTFEKSESSDRIRKTVVFDPVNDRYSLDYIEARMAAGESFNSIIKELVLQQITLLQLAPGHLGLEGSQTTGMTNQTTGMTEGGSKLQDPFGSFMSTE